MFPGAQVHPERKLAMSQVGPGVQARARAQPQPRRCFRRVFAVVYPVVFVTGGVCSSLAVLLTPTLINMLVSSWLNITASGIKLSPGWIEWEIQHNIAGHAFRRAWWYLLILFNPFWGWSGNADLHVLLGFYSGCGLSGYLFVFCWKCGLSIYFLVCGSNVSRGPSTPRA